MRKKVILTLLLLIAGIVYLKVFLPIFNIHIPCVFKKVTGLDCPGCGMTRASLALLDGNLYQAFRWNMLIFFIAPLLMIYLFFQSKKLFPMLDRNSVVKGKIVVYVSCPIC